MKFTKMQGAGNDYIYVNCFEETIENPSELAIKLSDRHFGIGSDGLVLIKKSDVADFKMEMYNSDGSRSQMCGNATRCIGKYVFERGLTTKTTITLETLAGIKIIKLFPQKGIIEVNMGEPILSPKEIPVTASSNVEKFIKQPLTIDGKTFLVTCVSMGNPHAVVFMESESDVDNLNIEKLGPLFENNKIFPSRINTEFAFILDENKIKMRVWERGSGETLACGTGACATLVAAVLCGLAKREATLVLRGGNLNIKWSKDDNCVYMAGGAEFVFDGEINC